MKLKVVKQLEGFTFYLDASAQKGIRQLYLQTNDPYEKSTEEKINDLILSRLEIIAAILLGVSNEEIKKIPVELEFFNMDTPYFPLWTSEEIRQNSLLG